MNTALLYVVGSVARIISSDHSSLRSVVHICIKLDHELLITKPYKIKGFEQDVNDALICNLMLQA